MSGASRVYKLSESKIMSNTTILSAEDIKNLVYGSSESGQSSKASVSERFEKVENPKFPFFSRPIPKLSIVFLISAPIFLCILYLTSGVGRSHVTSAQVLSGSSDSQMEKDNELLQKQLDELQVQNAILQQNFEDLQTQKDQVKIIKTKPQPTKIATAKVESKPVPKPIEPANPTPKTIPKTVAPIDPYEEWNRYANLGITIGDGFTEDEKKLEPKTSAVSSQENLELSSPNQDNNPQILAKLDTNNYDSSQIPQVTLGNSDQGSVNNSENNSLLNKEAQEILLSDTPNTSFLNAKRREYQQQDLANPDSIQSSESDETFLEAKRREYQQQDLANPDSIQPSESGETFLEAKRREYQQQDLANPAESVKFGSQITGELSQSISWVNGEQPQRRGIINLSEDLLANDGSVALPANSSIIVQVESERNGVVDFKAIAISYENAQGQLTQQLIPSETFLIQNEDNSPLIAREHGTSGIEIPAQDELLGLLGNDVRRNAQRVGDVVGELNKERHSRPDTLELEQGTKLTITVNSFLQITE